MAVLPSELGWKPVIRLQTGGLKVAELLYLAKERGCTADEAVEDLEKTGFGSRIESGVRTG